MRILFFINKFDIHDDLQGFFPGWVKETALRVKNITVIAQHVGEYDMPSNVQVTSMAKDENPSPLSRAIRFVGELVRLRGQYDHIIVMMAPSWSIIASFTAFVLGKASFLWYAVWKGSLRLRIATALSTRVLTSVPEAFPFTSQKVVMMGQGIDVNSFTPRLEQRKKGMILFLGRISRIKNIEFLLQGLALLKSKHPGLFSAVSVSIAGGPINAGDEKYYQELQNIAVSSGLGELVAWPGRIAHDQVVFWYRQADIVVNMTPTGSFDKAMLEAMACGALLLASNEALRRYYSPELQELLLFSQGNLDDFIEKLAVLIALPEVKAEYIRTELRSVVREHHSQQQWTNNLIHLLAETS